MVRHAAKLMKQRIPECFHPFIFAVDMSCGRNEWAPLLSDTYCSYDLDPPKDVTGAFLHGDWLEVTEQDIDSVAPDGSVRVLGFNPPFGKSSCLARKLIRHGMRVVKPDYVCLIVPFTVTENIRRWKGIKEFKRERVADFVFTKKNGEIVWNTTSYLVTAHVKDVVEPYWFSGRHSEQDPRFTIVSASPKKQVEDVSFAVRSRGGRCGWEFLTPEPWQSTLIESDLQMVNAPIPDNVIKEYFQHHSFILVQFHVPTPDLKKLMWIIWKQRGRHCEGNVPTIPVYFVRECVEMFLQESTSSDTDVSVRSA